MKTLKKTFCILLPTICCLVWMSTTQAQPKGENIFIIHDAVGKPDSSVVIYLEIKNDDNFPGYRADIPLPVGFAYVTGSAVNNNLRQPWGFVQVNMLTGTNIIRVIGFLINGTWAGNSGIVSYFALFTPTQASNYNLVSQNVIISSTQSQNLVTGVFNGCVFVTPQGSVPGDANCDELINVNDVVTNIHYILGNIPKPFCFANADLDNDLGVDVTDVIGIIYIILQMK